jgi:hypothetical protein
MYNCPVRDVTTESYWDFMNKEIPEEKNVFTPEIIKAIKGED